MIRKALMGIGLLAVGGFLLFGTRFVSYTRTAVNQATGYVQDQVPTEYEFDRIQHMIQDLDPLIAKAKRAIAMQEVELENLAKDVQTRQKAQEDKKTLLMTMNDKLKQGLVSYQVGPRTVSAEAFSSELNKQFAAFKQNDELIKAKQDVLIAQQSTLSAAQQKRDEMLRERQELETKLAQLKAQHELVEARKIANKEFVGDNGKISEIRKSITDMENRARVELKMIEQAGDSSAVKIEEIAPSNLGDQIDQYLGKNAPVRGEKL